MILYRAVSEQENIDFDAVGEFRIGRNTLEDKQFFKSIIAITEFVERSIWRNYQPPYRFLFTVHLDDSCFKTLNRIEMVLDGFDAVSIHEESLIGFNKCTNFVEQNAI